MCLGNLLLSVRSGQVIFLAIKITGESEGEIIFSSTLIEAQGQSGVRITLG